MKLTMSHRRWALVLLTIIGIFWFFTLLLFAQDCAGEPEDWKTIPGIRFRGIRCFLYIMTYQLPFVLTILWNWLYLIPRHLELRHMRSFFGYGSLWVVLAGLIHAQHPILFTEPKVTLIPLSTTHWFESSWYTLIALGFSAPLYLSYSWFVQRDTIGRLQTSRLEQELATLRHQINPHFFFNTLHNLYALALEQSEKTPDAIMRLSSLMRYAIKDAQEPLVPLDRELEIMDQYLELQQLRQARQVRVEQLTEGLQHDGYIPPMLIFTALENAFRHGVDSLRQDAWIRIDIQTMEYPPEVFLRVEIANNYHPASGVASPGTGLSTLARRLDLLFPEYDCLLVEQQEKVFSLTLKIPLQ